MNYVFDSSSLISLGKVKLLEKIKFLDGKKIIPTEVYDEVIKVGLEKGHKEAEYIQELIKNGVFTLKESPENLEYFDRLSKVDSVVLALAKETKSTAIIDEGYATAIAISQNIESHGSIYLILILIQKKIISKNEAIESIDRMINSGFYLSAIKYKEILHLINKQ